MVHNYATCRDLINVLAALAKRYKRTILPPRIHQSLLEKYVAYSFQVRLLLLAFTDSARIISFINVWIESYYERDLRKRKELTELTEFVNTLLPDFHRNLQILIFKVIYLQRIISTIQNLRRCK